MILADEINRAPPKTQAALLEAMQEHTVTAGGHTLELEAPFFVLATQNPIEQEGTYPLPEAQKDRFIFLVKVDYPEREHERQIIARTTGSFEAELRPVISAARRSSISSMWFARFPCRTTSWTSSSTWCARPGQTIRTRRPLSASSSTGGPARVRARI